MVGEKSFSAAEGRLGHFSLQNPPLNDSTDAAKSADSDGTPGLGGRFDDAILPFLCSQSRI